MDSKIVPVSSIAPEGWGPKEGGNATSPLHSRGSPKEGEQNQKSKPRPRVTMMPLGAPSITKYGSLVRPDAQIVALRAHCARTALKAPPRTRWVHVCHAATRAQRSHQRGVEGNRVTKGGQGGHARGCLEKVMGARRGGVYSAARERAPVGGPTTRLGMKSGQQGVPTGVWLWMPR